MTQHQHRLGFDDPDSLTRDGQLSVVRARGEGVEPFDTSLFAGFDSMKALTYTASIPMIVGLLRDFDYADFECIFGHQGILRPEITDIFGFQNTVDEKLTRRSSRSRRRTSAGRPCSTVSRRTGPASSWSKTGSLTPRYTCWSETTCGE